MFANIIYMTKEPTIVKFIFLTDNSGWVVIDPIAFTLDETRAIKSNQDIAQLLHFFPPDNSLVIRLVHKILFQEHKKNYWLRLSTIESPRQLPANLENDNRSFIISTILIKEFK